MSQSLPKSPVRFLPPPPQSMDHYLDTVTAGLVKGDVGKIFFDRLDRAINLIRQRPTVEERYALWGCLHARYLAYGKSKGWLGGASIEEESKGLAHYVLKEMLGVPEDPKDAVREKFVDVLKDGFKDHLGAKGKKHFEFLDFLHSLSEAKNSDEALGIILGKGAPAVVTAWVAKNREWLVARLSHFKGVPAPIRARIKKVLTLALKTTERVTSALKWLDVPFTFVTLILDSEEIADSETEARLGFSFQLQTIAGADVLGDVRAVASPKDFLVITPPGPMIKARLH
ncbi:hypothetical protein EYW49_04755 [Siculibacillus lacustris]|uniref:Uncharacterized protein n=1 Tax=Siculibacillus lacustris TaxID=1549641 RepID=A0A4V2KU48_9HYPH|nr:hypothetical protein [Siculibacillus lacustris]TBW39984.1 hypothetical protein EYW49_04755 [Siculibacillus lacustris]